jgi:hypothetical protein
MLPSWLGSENRRASSRKSPTSVHQTLGMVCPADMQCLMPHPEPKNARPASTSVWPVCCQSAGSSASRSNPSHEPHPEDQVAQHAAQPTLVHSTSTAAIAAAIAAVAAAAAGIAAVAAQA